jgi:hypothetical protein
MTIRHPTALNEGLDGVIDKWISSFNEHVVNEPTHLVLNIPTHLLLSDTSTDSFDRHTVAEWYSFNKLVVDDPQSRQSLD